jgi:hypothetical protein
MSEKEFWRCSPRKLYALLDVHMEMMIGKKKKKPKMGFIDQVL